MKKVDEKRLLRMLDANFNRAKEGLRVCEDICRFVEDLPAATRSLKDIRHGLTEAVHSFRVGRLILARDIEGDVGRKSSATELKRQNFGDIFYANSQRVKESLRVLEEAAKLMRVAAAARLKELRYQFYAVEKKVTEQSKTLFNSRHTSR